MSAIDPKPEPPKESLIAYVDGANLYWGLHDSSKRRHLWLDLVALCRRLRRRSRLVQVMYFMTPVVGEPAAQSRQAQYVAALRAKYPHLITVVEGRYQSKPVTCNSCGNSWVRREEKETDVNIAVHLVADAAQGRMQSALLVSADSDLAPAARTVRELDGGLFVAAAFPPKRYSNDLKALMPASFQINPNQIRRSQLPDEFDVGAAKFKRPAKWR